MLSAQTHSGFVARDPLLRQAVRQGSGFHALSSIIAVEMDFVCFGIFAKANIYGVIFASNSEMASFTDGCGVAFNFGFCVESKVENLQRLLS